MAQLIQPNQETPIAPVAAPRSGTSPVGTTSPNTGATAATNSTYAVGAFASGIAEPSGSTYTIQNTDYQGIVIFNTASAVAITLNSAVQSNFTCTLLNIGTGAITLTPTGGALVNGGASLSMAPHQGANVFFANRAWTAFVGATIIPTSPATIAPVAGEYLTGYDSTTGLFSQSTPAGISVTITTAAITPTGAQGSMTYVGGLLTAQTPAT